MTIQEKKSWEGGGPSKNSNSGLLIIITIGKYVNIWSIHVATAGLLAAVGSPKLRIDTSAISLTWTPPFSLDITDIDPDIEGYCVDVIDTSSSLVVHSECGITETQFSYPIPPNISHSLYYVFKVIAVNAIGNGTQSVIVYSESEGMYICNCSSLM